MCKFTLLDSTTCGMSGPAMVNSSNSSSSSRTPRMLLLLLSADT